MKYKKPEQRVLEREVREDLRYRARRVTGNKGRSREKQDLKRMVEEKDYDLEPN